MKNKGFTLIEVMIVVAIVGILLAIAIPSYQQLIESQKENATKANLQALKTAIASYYDDNGIFPYTLSNVGSGPYSSFLPIPTSGTNTGYFEADPKVSSNPDALVKLKSSLGCPATSTVYYDSTVIDDRGGWRYSTESATYGKIWINHRGNDTKGVPYSNYH